jgi:choline kinase
MQAVVLAAGSGRRMSPLSDARHKAMLRVGGTTILERLIAGLQMVGVDVVTVVTGYRSAEVRDYLCQQCPGPAYQFVENERYAQTNNVVSLLLALKSVERDDDVLLAECDLLVAPGVLQRLAGVDRGNVALLDRYRTGMDGTVVTVR